MQTKRRRGGADALFGGAGNIVIFYNCFVVDEYVVSKDFKQVVVVVKELAD
jgi:hypothetical protein